MGLRGQDGERGYAMAALLVTLAIMGVLLTILMPVWRHEAQREKEAELVFRGEQYARAIALFKFKNANVPNALPPSIDFLVENRFLRKKYKDPMTKDGEFVPLSYGSQTPGVPGGQPQPGPAQPGPPQPGVLTPPKPIQPFGRSNNPAMQPAGPGAVASGISGVRSKSEETSIRSYRGATRYDQWLFTFNIAPRPGGAMPMTNSPEGGRSADPNNPTGRRGFPQRGNPGRRGFGQGSGAGQGGGPGAGGPRGGSQQPPAGGTRGATPGGRGPGR
jgi:type II secretory pathway pseudopilin PulG